MKLDYLIDTNILVSLFNDELTESIPDGELGYSIITEIELLSFIGLEKDEKTLIRTHNPISNPLDCQHRRKNNPITPSISTQNS